MPSAAGYLASTVNANKLSLQGPGALWTYGFTFFVIHQAGWSVAALWARNRTCVRTKQINMGTESLASKGSAQPRCINGNCTLKPSIILLSTRALQSVRYDQFPIEKRQARVSSPLSGTILSAIYWLGKASRSRTTSLRDDPHVFVIHFKRVLHIMLLTARSQLKQLSGQSSQS